MTDRADMLEALLKTAPVSILQISADLHLLRHNSYFQTLSGYSDLELHHLSLLHLVPETQRTETESTFKQLFARASFRKQRQRLHRKDGTEFTVDMHGHVLKSASGSAHPTLLLVLEDVSDLVSSQERIQLSRRVDEAIAAAHDERSALMGILKALCETFNGSVAGFWRPDENGILTLVYDHSTDPQAYADFVQTNRNMQLATGEGLPGRVLKSVAPEWISILLSDTRFLRRESAHVSGLQSGVAFPICLEGQVIGVMEVFTAERRQFSPSLIEDLVKLSLRLGLVLRRLRKASALRALEAEFRQLQEAVDSIAMVVSTDTLGHINYANDLFCKSLGYTRDELLGRDLRELQVGAMNPVVIEDLWSTILRGETWTGETCTRAKDGRRVWFWTTWKAMRGPSGQIERYVSIRVDISDRKAAEEKMIRSAKLAALGEIAANIAHEINNPLSAIQARAKLTRTALESGTVDQAMLIESLDRMLNICNRIFKITMGLKRISRAAGDDDLEVTSLAQLLDDTLSFAQARLQDSNIGLQLPNIADAAEFHVRCRPSEISQVFINLLNNACDAIEGQSQKWIRIETRRTEDDRFEIWFTDSGPGIPPETARRIMEPFFTTKDSKHGTGLGLSISQRIVEEHGGRLELDPSSPNTRFIISLPAAKP